MTRTPGFPDVHVAVVQYAPTSEAVEVFAGFSEQELEDRISFDYENDPMIRAVRETLDFSERKYEFRIPVPCIPRRGEGPGLPQAYHVVVPLVEGELTPEHCVCHGLEVGPILGNLFNRYNGEGNRWSAVRFDLTFEEGKRLDVNARFGGEFITR